MNHQPVKLADLSVNDSIKIAGWAIHLIGAYTRLVLICLFVWIVVSGKINAQNVDSEVSIQWGFNEQIRLGFWQPFFITLPDRIQPTEFELRVLDGDETPIIYRGPLHPAGQNLNRQQGYVKLGRSFGTAELGLFDRDGTEVYRHSYPMDRSLTLPASRPMVLTVESTGKIAQTISTTSIGEKEDRKKFVVRLEQPNEQMPLESFCYEAVGTIIFSLNKTIDLSQITPNQWEGLENWVRDGGKLIVSIPPEIGESEFGKTGISRFFDGRWIGKAELTNSQKLENFTASTPLIEGSSFNLAISRIETEEGRIILDQDGLALIVRRSYGLGEVTLTTFDLEHPLFAEWGGFRNLIYQLQHGMNLQDAAQSQRASVQSGAVSHAGYDDLIGQLRVALDRFSQVQFLPFSIIALLIGLYILCVGPADYFLLRKFTRKMELTWISFPMITLLFCGLAIWITQRTRPTDLQINQLEIVDIDSISGHVRGSIWSNLYSPNGGEFEIELSRSNPFVDRIDSDMVSWHGLPGKGYGGMETKSSTGFFQSGYYHLRDELENDLRGFSRLSEVPIFVSSTKPFFIRYQAGFQRQLLSNLRLRARAARLEGTITNPFDFPLDKCRIFFENYVYVLDNRWEAGETISIESETKERTIVSLLTRRQRAADDVTKMESVPWSENETRLQRIADMLMFHSAVGGSNYTSGLSHSYHNFVDLSDMLKLGRAIIVAESPVGGTPLVVNQQSSQRNIDQSATLIRLVVPVTYSERRR